MGRLLIRAAVFGLLSLGDAHHGGAQNTVGDHQPRWKTSTTVPEATPSGAGTIAMA